MKKKLSLFIFILLINFMFTSGVRAEIFEYICEYDNTHKELSLSYTNSYNIKFQYDSAKKMLSLKSCEYIAMSGDSKSCELTMTPISWDSAVCPASFKKFSNSINPTDSKGSLYTADYIHYWDWECEYDLSSLNNSKFKKLTINYRNKVSTESGFAFKNINIYYDADTEPGDVEARFESVINDEKCTNIKLGEIFTEHGKTILPFYVSKDGNIKGDLKSFDDNRTSSTKTGSSICPDHISPESCRANPDFACVWEENESAPNGGFCNVDNLLYVGCGGATDIPKQAPAIISFAVNLLKIATPIILIFVSVITLLKAMAGQKEDEIKKATSSLVKKIIAAVLVFFVISIVQFIISVVSDDEEEYTGFEHCLNCFLNNKCDTAIYYKTVVEGEDFCTPLVNGITQPCENLFDIWFDE